MLTKSSFHDKKVTHMASSNANQQLAGAGDSVTVVVHSSGRLGKLELTAEGESLMLATWCLPLGAWCLVLAACCLLLAACCLLLGVRCLLIASCSLRLATCCYPKANLALTPNNLLMQSQPGPRARQIPSPPPAPAPPPISRRSLSTLQCRLTTSQTVGFSSQASRTYSDQWML